MYKLNSLEDHKQRTVNEHGQTKTKGIKSNDSKRLSCRLPSDNVVVGLEQGSLPNIAGSNFPALLEGAEREPSQPRRWT